MKRLLLVCALAGSSPVAAQDSGFYPSEICQHVLDRASDVDKLILAAWVSGYLDHRHGASRIVDLDNMKVVLRNLNDICGRNPQATILQLVEASTPGDANTPGSAAHAKAMLAGFLAVGADTAALTAGIKPTEDDIRRVFLPPLADRLVPYYAALFTPDVQIRPKPGQTELRVIRATTTNFKRGDPVLKDFPPEYADLTDQMLPGIPIVRFAFVAAGSNQGTVYDALVFVGGRWVFMPSPWQALD
ncbi:hypothetical protein VK792_02895 [Mesobacterium sp. TK19101]|uniref:Uncharacterized protein n=1 Tax=Mesobacterium hydrothermale TaxID=3111907 RepID=A0ABU6HCM7_9RHOB|nr:hypothetical protein [Mesobacterium sp. TK19101]MEC3860218.1 hypothetical protein [Mesobacterium sp. TK19101]